jgi:hypothetical protein
MGYKLFITGSEAKLSVGLIERVRIYADVQERKVSGWQAGALMNYQERRKSAVDLSSCGADGECFNVALHAYTSMNDDVAGRYIVYGNYKYHQ